MVTDAFGVGTRLSLRLTDVKLAVALGFSVLLGLTGGLWYELFNRFARLELDKAGNGGWSMLLFLWICVFVIWFTARDLLEERAFQVMFMMLLFAAVTQPLAFTFSLWSRALLPFKLSLLFLLPRVVARFGKDGSYVYTANDVLMEILFLGLLSVLFYANGIDRFVLFTA